MPIRLNPTASKERMRLNLDKPLAERMSTDRQTAQVRTLGRAANRAVVRAATTTGVDRHGAEIVPHLLQTFDQRELDLIVPAPTGTFEFGP